MDKGMRDKNSMKGCRSRGFTLVELLISMALMSIITLAIYNMYISQYKTWVSQDLVTEVQQNARVTIDTISRDLLITGYGVTTQIETGSNNAQLAVRYKDVSVTSDPFKRLTYRLGTVGDEADVLYRKVQSAASEGSAGPPATGLSALLLDFGSGGEPLSENITSLNFKYFDASGVEITTAANFTQAYRIKITITARTSKNDPITGVRKSYTLSTDIRPRNIGISGVSSDITPPAIPGRPTVTDPHLCGVLNVSWTAVADTDGDLDGYGLYYSTSPDPQTYKKTALGNLTSATLPGLDNGATYYIALTSRDKAGNESLYSPAAHGDGIVSVDGSSSPINDTTPNADPPGQPVGLDATASITGGPSVTLTWQSNSITYSTAVLHTAAPAPAPGGSAGPGYGPDTEVGSYEIWRSPDNVTFTQIDPATGEVVSGGYMDKYFGESDKCSMFYYKIRAVNSCDPTKKSPFSDTVNGDGSKSLADVPTSGVTNTMPSDSTKPAAPTNAFSKAGFGRTYMNWDNPGDADLDHVEIRYNSALGSVPPYPKIVSEPPVVLDGTAVENGTVKGSFAKDNIGTVYKGGSFAPGATALAFTHYGSLVETPNLLAGYTYAYSIFAVDRCGNVSNPASTAQTTVGQCGEETTTTAPGNKTIGAPRWPADNSNFTMDACSQYHFYFDRIKDTYPSGIYDLAGYYVYRRQNTTSWTPSSGDQPGFKYMGLILNPAAGNVDFTDFGINPDTDPAIEGKTYQYYTIPIDCNREQNSNAAIAGNPWATITEAPSPDPKASEVITVRPGMPTFRNSTSVTSGDLGLVSSWDDQWFYNHQNVNLHIDNTSAASVQIKSIQLAWTNASSQLLSLWERTATSLSWPKLGAPGSPNSPATITFSTPIVIKGITDPLYTPLNLWTYFSEDMRDDTVTIQSIDYLKTFDKSGSLVYPECIVTTLPSNSTNFYVPVGPINSGTSQNRTSTNIVTSTPTYGSIVAASTYDINVYTHVTDTSFAGIKSVKLYYLVTDQTVKTPDYWTFSTWTPLTMNLISGGDYALFNTITSTGTKIPAQPGMRVWYYIVSVDNKGNIDRDPEFSSDLVYTYDHTSVDPCLFTPSPATNLTGAAVGPQVNLSWTAPTTYTDGSNLAPGDWFKYRVYRRNGTTGAFYRITTGPCLGDLSTTSCSDTGQTSNGVALDVAGTFNSYRVLVINSCSSVTLTSCDQNALNNPSPASQYCSARSNNLSLCAGGGTDRLLNVLNPAGPIAAGSSFTITVTDCTVVNGALTDFLNDLSVTSNLGGDTINTYAVPESVDGTFTWVLTTVTPVSPATCPSAATHPGQICVNPTWTSNDTVTVSLSMVTAGASSRPITVTKSACSAPPAAPANFRLTNAQVNGNNVDTTAKVINLAWDANTEPDLNGYKIWVSKNGAAATVATLPVKTDTSYAYTPAAADTEGAYYTFYMTANDTCPLDSANSSTIGPVYRSCGVTPATAPTLSLTNAVTAYDDHSGNVGLSWNNLGADTDKYEVERATSVDAYATWTNVATVTGLTYSASVASVPEGTGVKYRVRAVDKCGKYSPYSTATAAVTKSCQVVPAAPTGFAFNPAPTVATDTTVNLKWNANTDADKNGYKAYVNKDGGAWATGCTATAAATSCTANTSDGLALGSGVYSWKLVALDTCTAAPLNESVATAALSENLTCTTPNAPTSLSLVIGDGTQNESQRSALTAIHVKFTAPQANSDATNLTNLSSYDLIVTQDGGAPATTSIPLTACTSSLPDPAAGATCDYTYNTPSATKMKDNVWSFSVKSKNSCGLLSGALGPKGETCTASNNCPVSY